MSDATIEFPPAFLLLAAAAALPFLPRAGRALLSVAAPLAGLALLYQLESGARVTASFAGFELRLLEVGATNVVFGTIFLLISALASIYAWHVVDRGQQVAALLYAAGALGVTFAGDLLTLLIFWELMAVASSWLVFARRRTESTRAGWRYLLAHMAGGTVLLGGILLHFGETGSLLIEPLSSEGGVAAWLILAGVALNVALPPLHAWLPDAYPQATVTGAIFMSALTTKSAVYALLMLFPGWQLLVYMGVAMALYGVVYAVLANDIRQILAYHIVSQVGYMVAGVGIGTELSMNGTVAHAYSHILYKGLLFMGAGAVIQATGVSRLSDLGGLAKKMRPVVWLFMIGAFSISGFPLFNGFVSKSMIVSASGEAHYTVAMLGLLLASVGTFLHTGLKIPVFTFWGKDQQLEVRRLPGNMYLAMGLVAFLCVFYGVFPEFLYQMLPYEAPYHPYTAYHLVEATQLLAFTFIGFWILRSKLAGEPYIALDTDWFFRRGAPVADRLLVGPVNAAFARCEAWASATASLAARAAARPLAWLPQGETANPGSVSGPVGWGIGLSVFLFAILAAMGWW